MIKKCLCVSIFFLSLSVFFLSCGIKDSLFLKAPENLRVYNNRGSVNDMYLAFDAFNQEKEEGIGNYLIVGYELWYYFDNINEAKICNVFYPDNTKNPTLIDFASSESARFPSASFTKSYVYTQASVPVTTSMIDDALTDGNSANVLIYFGDNSINGTLTYDTSANTFSNSSGDLNPHLKSGDTVVFDYAYPVKSECDTLFNYNAASREDYQDHYYSNFAGFFTAEYYTYVKGRPSQTVYTVKFYVTAIGFESDSSRGVGNIQLRSDPSNTISVDFLVNSDDSVFPNTRS